jgi:hypothetical protein
MKSAADSINAARILNMKMLIPLPMHSALSKKRVYLPQPASKSKHFSGRHAYMAHAYNYTDVFPAACATGP